MKFYLLIALLALPLFAGRYVTLGPAVTNHILLLGHGDEIVGKTSYCDSSAGKPGEVVEVGSLLSLSVETILTLKPDHVFAVGLTPVSLVEKLRSLGVTVSVIDDPSSFGALCDNFLEVGTILHEKERADSIVQLCKSRVAELPQVSDSLKVFVQLGNNPLYTVVANSLGNEFIDLLGGKNIFTRVGSGQVSREFVLQSNPDVILVSEMGEQSQQEIQQWYQFPTIDAVKKKAVYLIDAYELGSPTPVSFVETVKSVRNLIGIYE